MQCYHGWIAFQKSNVTLAVLQNFFSVIFAQINSDMAEVLLVMQMWLEGRALGGCFPCSPRVLPYFIFIWCFTAEPPRAHVDSQERGSQPFCSLRGETPDRHKSSPSCPFFWPFPSLQITVWPVLMCHHLPDTFSLLLSDGLDSCYLALVLAACS